MRKAAILAMGTALGLFSFVNNLRAQPAGTLEFTARITPTAARPEPVREFTFYVLTKSYGEIVKEVEEKDMLPKREEFIDGLKISPELRAWLKAHDVLDLTTPDLDKALTPDDLIRVPEFLLAYQRSNSGGVTVGIPKPKYSEMDRTEHPERYERQRQEYLAALKKFIQAHPETVAGVELEMDAVNPQRKWEALHNEHKSRVQRNAPEVAQLKYLAAKADTDLEGRGSVSSLLAGSYWISSLDLDAAAGDKRLRWDVPVRIEPGKTSHIDLTNLNAVDTRTYNP